MRIILLFSVFIIATCGLIYELIAGALASYLLGDSITQFSTVIGVYLSAMGIGSYLSKYVEKNLMHTFIQIELLIGLIGGCSAALLFLSFEFLSGFQVLLYSLVGIIGILVGLEIPLMMRIMKNHYEFKDLVSNVFTFDYIGALMASLLFPLFLVPYLGLTRSAFLFGGLNVLVGGAAIYFFKDQLVNSIKLRSQALIIFLFLMGGFLFSNEITSLAESATYENKIIFTKSSPYQRIVLTRNSDDLRLFLNGNLQFSSQDEYRYHETLVHPGLSRILSPKKILVLGGGDGLAVREILKYPTVEKITLVDLDPSITTLFQTHPILTTLNQESLNSPKVTVINADAYQWLKKSNQTYDFIVIDFPDPSNFSIGKLYSNSFFRLLFNALQENGAAVVQSTSPYVARQSFWCVAHTLESVGFIINPYHTHVPSFGDWGFVLASKTPLSASVVLPERLRYLSKEIMASLFTFSSDMDEIPTEINRLNNQTLVRYFEDEWSKYLR